MPPPSSFIGLSVNVQLHNGSSIDGTITRVDAAKNTLHLKTTNGKAVALDRTGIASLSVREGSDNAASNLQQQQQQQQQAPDVAQLPTPTGKKGGNKRGGKKPNNRYGNGNGNGNGNGFGDGDDGYAAVPAEDFDFEASARSFDKQKIWQQIRAQDHSDPAALLVAHNRAVAAAVAAGDASSSSPASSPMVAPASPYGKVKKSRGEEGPMRKLRNDENVLSPEPEEVVPPQQASTSGSDSTSVALARENAILKRRLYILESLAGLSLQARESDGDSLTLDCTINAPQPTTFTLQSSLEESDAKVRFKPDAAATALPEKYNREMGLRLDNGSARVFLQRLVGAVQGAGAEGSQ